jgi:hypothetical protein
VAAGVKMSAHPELAEGPMPSAETEPAEVGAIVRAAAGTPMSVFSVEPRSLVEACDATVVDLKEGS